MNNRFFTLVIGLLVLPSLSFANFPEIEPRAGFQWDAFSKIAVQDRGRMKPIDTLAVESVQLITGKRKCGKLSAIECMTSWILNYERDWSGKAFIKVGYKPLKEKIGLPVNEDYFSPETLKSNASLGVLARQVFQKQQMKERLDTLESKVVDIQNQLGVLGALVSGDAVVILPNPKGLSEGWFALSSLENPSSLPYTEAQINSLGQGFGKLVEAFVEANATKWNEGSSVFANLLREDLGKGGYPTAGSLEREYQYNHKRPFMWAWILYLVFAISTVLYFLIHKPFFRKLGYLFLGLGIVTQITGITIRCLISGRPPVTNMYESVIWVSLGCIVFSILIWRKTKREAIPLAASIFTIVCLILADNAPVILNPNIHTLEPVLRSNYWLTIHVLTITLSYAAFALSLCLGNVVLGKFVFKPSDQSAISLFSVSMYKAMQIGVVLLAAGTILGGVWADYSWGRFWGWDPKEVWALVALLLYLAVLHGRFTGWLKGFGFVAATVICFLGILMAWYGVNFVLGAGLHSYGFGSGGLGWVVGYILFQLGFIVLAWVRYKQLGRTAPLPSDISTRWKSK